MKSTRLTKVVPNAENKVNILLTTWAELNQAVLTGFHSEIVATYILYVDSKNAIHDWQNIHTVSF